MWLFVVSCAQRQECDQCLSTTANGGGCVWVANVGCSTTCTQGGQCSYTANTCPSMVELRVLCGMFRY